MLYIVRMKYTEILCFPYKKKIDNIDFEVNSNI